MRIGTLFSGIGSPEQGASRVYDDLDLVFACEWDKYARESFNANYEIAAEHFHKDISDMDGTQYKDKVDIIIGGSPCQDFSIAGLRAGIEGNKGVLIYEYIRIIEEVSPPIFIYENVKGMLSDQGGRTIKEFVEAFREMGYYCHYEVLNTKDYGVPQNRERIFLVGFKCHEHYYNFSFAKKQKLITRLKDLLEDEVDEKYYLSDTRLETLSKAKRSIEPRDVNTEYASCLVAGYSKVPTDGFYLKVPSATSKGYEEATEGDSINLTHPRSTTRRGRVGKQVAQTLDCACNQAVVENIDTELKNRYNGVTNKEVDNEKSALNERNTIEALQILWEQAREKAFKRWEFGIFGPLQQESILQSRLYVKIVCKGWEEQSNIFSCSRNSEEDKEAFYKERLLREMWKEWEVRYTSYRRGLSEQQHRELDDFMQKLPHENSQTEADMQIRGLQYESQRLRVLREALSEVQEVGKSSQSEKTEKQNYRIRKLTTLECLRLQDFPDEFHANCVKAGLSNSQLYKQAGNSISANVMEMIFNQIEKSRHGSTVEGSLF